MGHVHQFHVFHGTHEFGHDRRSLHRILGTHIDLQLADGSLFRRDGDDAVGSPDTVDGRSAGILENRERLDLLGVDRVEITFDAIDQNQRRRIALEGGHAADPEIGPVVADLARPLHGDDSRDVSRQRLTQGRFGGDRKSGRLNRGDGSNHALLLLRTESDDHDIVDIRGIGQQLDIIGLVAFDRNRLRLVTDKTELQFAGSGDLKAEAAPRVRGCPEGGPLDGDRGPDHRLQVLIHDVARDPCLVLGVHGP